MSRVVTSKCHTALFIQARLDSSRLPGKVVLPLAGMRVIDIVLRNLSGCAEVQVLLCPEECSETFQPVAKRWGYQIITGPKEDVLARFALGMEVINPDWIIRATADNTVVSAELARQLLDICKEKDVDYGCFTQTPYGAGVEVIRAEALRAADREATSVHDREHVCPFIVKNTDRFSVYYPVAPQKWQAPGLRATLDTAEDYEYLQKFHNRINGKNFEILEEFIAWSQTI